MGICLMKKIGIYYLFHFEDGIMVWYMYILDWTMGYLNICPDITFNAFLMVFDDEIRFKLATWLTKTEESS